MTASEVVEMGTTNRLKTQAVQDGVVSWRAPARWWGLRVSSRAGAQDGQPDIRLA